MATDRVNLQQAAAAGRADLARIDATTEDDIARHHIEDSLELDGTEAAAPAGMLEPAEIRRRLGLTQAQMVERLDIPLRTWRNWEQGRVALEPTVRVLLKLLSVDPEDVFQKLSGFRLPAEAVGHLNRLVKEPDPDFVLREAVTSGVPIEEEAGRVRALDTEHALDRIVQKTKAARR